MDSLDQLLSVLASIAGIFGVVIAFLQYRVKNQGAGPPPPGAPPVPPRAWGPPPVVRAAAIWVVVESVVTVLLLYGVFTRVMADIYGFGFSVPTLPEAAVALGPIGLAALIGVVSVPVAIRRGTGLRDGDPAVRGKLLGSAAKDLFVGVALAIAAQVFAGVMPEAVFSILMGYLVWSILS
ncbi:hypothetical protein, partial [Actinophytocola sp.]|uniref:hypothetical protein n=1 Tax=Actinophytocola sp. TaxID=1872138 RepID=UPI00389AC714